MKEEVYYSLEAALANPEEVAQLNLAGNDLISLPPEIWQLPNLMELYLSGNRLTSLPPEIGQLSNLEKLDLSKNRLTSEAKKEIKQLLPYCTVLVGSDLEVWKPADGV